MSLAPGHAVELRYGNAGIVVAASANHVWVALVDARGHGQPRHRADVDIEDNLEAQKIGAKVKDPVVHCGRLIQIEANRLVGRPIGSASVGLMRRVLQAVKTEARARSYEARMMPTYGDHSTQVVAT